jgi:hypothetical protein
MLDAVLTVRDSSSRVILESDDAPEPTLPALPFEFAGPNPDSRLLIPAGDVHAAFDVEVTDRYGRGGPEYGYVIEAGPAAPDLRVVVDSDPDVIALRPGESTVIGARVERVGRTGPIRLRVEGLPEGASAAPVVARFNASNLAGWDAAVARVDLIVRTGADVRPGRGLLSVVGSASLEGAWTLTRTGERPMTVETVAPNRRMRTVVGRTTRLPFCVYTGGKAR